MTDASCDARADGRKGAAMKHGAGRQASRQAAHSAAARVEWSEADRISLVASGFEFRYSLTPVFSFSGK